MKVTEVKTYWLRVPLETPFTSSRGWWYKSKNAMLVEVLTDEGISGWGEAYGPAGISKAAVDTVLGPRLIGRDPFHVQAIWDDLYNHVKDYGMGGMVISALSAIDIALWDIMGKATQKPIHDMLGGARRDKVEAYATGFYFTDLSKTLETAVAEARKYRDLGFRAAKIKIGLGSFQRDLERIDAVIEAMGPGARIMVDANHCYDVPNAIQLGRELERRGIYWFEEPISPEDLDGYQEVTRKLDIPIAGGENEFTRYGFGKILDTRAMDIIQPDVCAAGGLTECRNIALLANARWIRCIPHAWGSIIGLVATMHFIAALPDNPPCLIPDPPILEWEQTHNPFREDLSNFPLRQVNGWVDIPQKPGLGLEVDRDVISKYLVET